MHCPRTPLSAPHHHGHIRVRVLTGRPVRVDEVQLERRESGSVDHQKSFETDDVKR